ncbi:MAG: hypothetical protein KDJ55_09575 [Rhodobiaceae bacterium]|nr:hypothetical protein [Rhodobiaceae bacterium]MCC0060761.1 hypothetical protein [Rhodobiaceae bacterium]
MTDAALNGESRVLIRLPQHGKGRVEVDLSAVGDVAGMLAGTTTEEALFLIPTLFSVCATAQAHAAVTAVESAMGAEAPRRTQTARQALTAMETLREHVLRIALDWPGFYGGTSRAGDVRAVMQFVRRLQTALFDDAPAFLNGIEPRSDTAAALAVCDEAEALLEREVFSEPPAIWLGRLGRNTMRRWALAAGTPAGNLLAHVADKGWLDAAAGNEPSAPASLDDLLAAWRQGGFTCGAGRTHPESTSLSRRAGHPVLEAFGGTGIGARLIARLVEVASLPGEIRDLIAGTGKAAKALSTRDGNSVAAVEAARGRLVHAAEIADGRVVRWGFLPPTNVNFAPGGIAAECLAQLAADNDGERLGLASLVVNAIDPCVAYDVRMH